MGDLGLASLYLVTGAMTAYLVSMIAFAIDLTGKAASRTPAMVAAGAAAGGSGSGSGSGAVTGQGSSSVSQRKAARVGMSTFWVATGLLLVGLVTRGIAAGRVPWANMYEFTLVGILVASFVFLGIQRTRDVRYVGTFVAGAGVVGLFLALTVLYVAAEPVQPILENYWLVIHVAVATAGMGVFGVGAVFSGLQIAKDRAVASGKEQGRVLSSLPAADVMDRLAYRINAVGFVLWTFTLISGAIWAEHAWSRYWGWDPKEVVSLIIWVIYAAYLHARATRGWEGRKASWFSIIGFIATLVNFYGVNLFVNSLHSYSGL